MNLMERFDKAYQTDDEDMDKKSERLIATYEQSDIATKAVIDDIFLTLTGWGFNTLMEGGETE